MKMAAIQAVHPLFTQRHIHHSSVWSLKGFSVPTLCLACVTERLEDRTELSLHHKRVLGELQALIAANDTALFQKLSSDRRVLDHLSITILGLLATKDGSIAQASLEVLGGMCSHFSTTELPRKLMQKSIQTIMTTQRMSDGLAFLTFLGRLLHSLPPLCSDMTNSFGGFLEQLLRGLAYPDEKVKSAIVYILAQLSTKTAANSLPASLVQSICGHVSSNLASAKSHTLTLNLLGLVKGMLKSSIYAKCLLETDRHTSEAKGSTLASAFKRVLLSTDDTLQLSGVQCVTDVLTHHPQYGQTLLCSDIAEFMFEALKNKKNKSLMMAIFSCLNLLATLDDFYSKGHIVYGIDQVIDGVLASLQIKNYRAVELGFTLLSTILQRQSTNISLFTSATGESLKKLLQLIETALQTSVVTLVLPAINTFSFLLSSSHLPTDFPLSNLLPLLSLLLHLLELHVLVESDDRDLPSISSSQLEQRPEVGVAGNFNPLHLLKLVLKVMESVHKVYLEGKRSNGEKYPVSEELIVFLSISFEESILPALLLKAEVLESYEPFSAFFSIARVQLEGVAGSPNTDLAVKLANVGFIPFSFDIKHRFFTNSSGDGSLCGCVNECLEVLCACLESNAQRRGYVKELLHSALPNINCELEKSLDFLIQRPSGSDSSISTLSQLQRSILALFYFMAITNTNVAEPVVVLQALDRFLVLNPDIHLMPTASLTHLTTLYAMTVKKAGIELALSTEGKMILVRALLRVATPALVFSGNPVLLQWAFSQPPLQAIARIWFWEWFKCASESVIVQFIKTTPNTLDTLLAEVSGEVGCSQRLFSFLDKLLSEHYVDSGIASRVFNHLQRVLLAQRIHPLSDSMTASMMRLLAQSLLSSSASTTPDLKLVYHATTYITRCCSESVVDGLVLLSDILTNSIDINSQALSLLQNNSSFLTRLVSCVPTSSKPQDHSTKSASALKLIACIIRQQNKAKVVCTQSAGVLSCQSVLASLLHQSPTIVLSGLYFWQVVLATRAFTGSFTLYTSDDIFSLSRHTETMQKLQFLLQNCLARDHKLVKEASAQCLIVLFKYLSTIGAKEPGVDMWSTCIMDHISTTCLNSHIPPYYLPCLEAIICQTPVNHSSELKDIAHLLYQSAVNTFPSNDDKTLPTLYAKSLSKIHSIDDTLLDSNQWRQLKKVLPQIHT